MRRALVVAAALVCAPSLARAHGGLPISQHILRQNGGDQMFVPVVFWGLWVSQPDGRWKWICEELINQNRTRRFALSTDGTFYTTDIKGLTQSTDNGCTWKPAGGDIANLHTTDVDVDPVDGATAYATTGDGGTVLPDGGIIAANNAVYATHDHGATWTPLAGLAAQSSRLFTSVRVAPSSGMILYATSNNQSSPYSPALHRSTDGGANFSTATLSYMLDGVAPHTLELLAIDPRNSNVVWARAIAEVPEGSTSVTRHGLIRSSDGGMTWSELYKLDATNDASGAPNRGIDGVAFDGAQNRTYVATRTGLLAGSDDGSVTVPTLAPTGTLQQTQCVDVHGGALYACSSQFQPDNAAIARSTDNGQTFTSVLNYVDTLGPVDCPAGTPVGDLCPQYWYMYGAQLGISFDGGTGGNDAGMMMKSGGCGCTIGAVESAVGGAAFATLLLALALRIVARSGGRARRRD
ncbi:MAG TPA: sialidase family protein [Polyangia bacterium]